MEEFLAFFSFHSCSRAGIFNLTLVSFSPSQDSESHQTTSRQWLCRSPCGVTLQGSTCSCKQTTLASTPSSLQTGREAGSCEQFLLCQQACPTQQRAGSQVPVSSFPCASRLPLQAGWRADGPLPQDFFLTTPSARLLPQDFLFKTSPGQPGSSRPPEGRLFPLQALLCCCLQTCLQ